MKQSKEPLSGLSKRYSVADAELAFRNAQRKEPQNRETIAALCADLRQELRKSAAPLQIAQSLKMLCGGMIVKNGAAAEDIITAYIIALSGISDIILDDITACILRGQVEGLSRRFLPSAPELAAYGRARAETVRLMLARLEKIEAQEQKEEKTNEA